MGAITTLGLVLKTYSDIHDKFKELYIMGGNDPSIGLNPNVGELNFVQDPEAVDIVLRSFKSPITILPWETTVPPNIFIPIVSIFKLRQ